jgi:putative endonuclease
MWHAHRSVRQEAGRGWEERALAYLHRHGLQLIEQNYRCKGGELDLIMREGDSVVFVEVRQRADRHHGGPLGSITPAKVRRLRWAAQSWLLHQPSLPPCRFDVIAIEGERIEWLRDAIEST